VLGRSPCAAHNNAVSWPAGWALDRALEVRDLELFPRISASILFLIRPPEGFRSTTMMIAQRRQLFLPTARVTTVVSVRGLPNYCLGLVPMPLKPAAVRVSCAHQQVLTPRPGSTSSRASNSVGRHNASAAARNGSTVGPSGSCRVHRETTLPTSTMQTATPAPARETMNRKPVLYREAKTVLTFDAHEFHEKQLCDGITLNPGDACAYSCEFCYVKGAIWKIDKPVVDAFNRANHESRDFHEVVIRRRNATALVAEQLKEVGAAALSDPMDNRVVFGSTLVDVAANLELLRETAAACNLIFEHTHWQVRLLSKSNLLHKLVDDLLVPTKWHQRLILGVSTGTLDDNVAAAIETGTPRVSKRIESLRWLQERGIRTFGMICPSLPQENYDKFSREICGAIGVERCEHVWAEVINLRGKSLTRTVAGLQSRGLDAEAQAMTEVSESKEKWEEYARATFTAHIRHVPPGRLRFLQYVTNGSASWWADRREQGAVLLGEVAKKMKLTAIDAQVLQPTPLSSADRRFLEEKEGVVTQGVRASIAAAKALFEIHTYKGGLLWRQAYLSFEAYCRDRWDYRKAHAYRLVNCGDLVTELQEKSPKGDRLPRTESEARPLLVLPREARVATWTAVVSGVKDEELSARVIATKVREYVKANGIEVATRPRRKAAKAEQAAAALARLRAAVEGLKNAGQIVPLLEKVEGLIDGGARR
jgi:DNA repair photolyase